MISSMIINKEIIDCLLMSHNSMYQGMKTPDIRGLKNFEVVVYTFSTELSYFKF